MKLKFISLLMFAMLASNAMASLVATLYHEGDVQMFYTSTALAEAVKVAQSGDLICLSSGTFNDPDTIKKAITIRGTSVKSWTKVETLCVNIPDDDTASCKIECLDVTYFYLKGNAEHVQLIKDRVKSLNMNSCSKSNIIVRNCYIFYYLYKEQGVNVSFVNCFLYTYAQGNKSGMTCSLPQAIFVNCLVSIANRNSSYLNTLENSIFYNCLITGYTNMASSVEKYNCLLYYTSPLNKSNGSNNYTLKSTDFVSKSTSSNSYSSDCITSSNYVLTDSIRTTKLGSDGTEIGLHGGAYPFTLEPSYPVITSMKVAGKVTADEKLSVDIEVHSQQ